MRISDWSSDVCSSDLANTVQISLSADTSTIDAIRKDLSSNQNATLDGVISVAGQNASADAALQSSDPKDALNQLSGELHRSEERRVGKSVSVRVDLGGRRNIKKKKIKEKDTGQ